MAEEQKGEVEISGPGGLGVRTKGYRLMDMVCLASAFGVGYICLSLYNHDANAKDDRTIFVQAIKEATDAQREMVRAQREANCLARLTLQEKARPENIEFCRQLGRGR